jgi:hypothetical protein
MVDDIELIMKKADEMGSLLTGMRAPEAETAILAFMAQATAIATKEDMNLEDAREYLDQMKSFILGQLLKWGWT